MILPEVNEAASEAIQMAAPTTHQLCQRGHRSSDGELTPAFGTVEKVCVDLGAKKLWAQLR